MHPALKTERTLSQSRHSQWWCWKLALLMISTLIVGVLNPQTTIAQQDGFTASSNPLNPLNRLDNVGPDASNGRVATQVAPALPESMRAFQGNRQNWEAFPPSRVAQASFDGQVQPENPASSAPASSIPANDSSGTTGSANFSDMVSGQAEQMLSREGTASSVKIALLLATLSLAPAIILMTTCYVRIVVVLTLLRQAFGSQQLPSTQILTALSLFVTFLVMAPTWNEIKTEAIEPYSAQEITWQEAWHSGLIPVKRFMSRQIEIAKNEDAVAMFYQYLPEQAGTKPSSLNDVPVNVLLPAYLVSELKVAFLLGFQIYLPFLIVDLVVSSVTVSMGMVMLPPTMVSFPLKLILFVLVDGWNLVIAMLLQSFGT